MGRRVLHPRPPPPGARRLIAAGSTRYRIGTAPWTDPTLVQADVYPAAARTAEARLRCNAERFDTVEVDSRYYALPSERNAALWAERTPTAFHVNVKAFALLTGHAADTRALPAIVREQLPAAGRGEPRVQEVPEDPRRLCFDLFHSALEPLRRARKLGVRSASVPALVRGDAGARRVCRAMPRPAGGRRRRSASSTCTMRRSCGLRSPHPQHRGRRRPEATSRRRRLQQLLRRLPRPQRPHHAARVSRVNAAATVWRTISV